MPIESWKYKVQVGASRHIGPVAQDFHAAFNLGEDLLQIGPHRPE
ncbi:MAG: tail fiber domain-containing protein [Kiloniellales bacterium]